MRLQLSLIALAWAPAVAQYGCTICKGGRGITRPDGIVTSTQGEAVSCLDLVQTVSQLSGDDCETMQRMAKEPCGCPEHPGYDALPDETVTNESEPETPIAPEESEPVTEESEAAVFVCSVCESGDFTKPDAFTLDDLGNFVTCQELHDKRDTIPEDSCSTVQEFAATSCGCDVGTPATIDTILQVESTPFECSVCGNGVIGNPNGVVSNGHGSTRTCEELERNKANIPSSVCSSLQNTAINACECRFDQEAIQEIVLNSDAAMETQLFPEVENQNAVVEVAETLSRCSICGDGEITIPDGVVTTSNGNSARCDVLEANPKEITQAACASVQAISREPCGCVFPYKGTTPGILDEILPFECSICGQGKVTILDGIVITPEGQAARCDALEANAKTIPEDICPDIQQLSNEPCGCSEPEGIEESKICHVCKGAAKKVGNPSAMVTTPSGLFTCDGIFEAGLGGFISMDECGAVQAAVENECGCYTDEITDPPSSIFQCSICSDGMLVTQPDGVVNTETGMTCAQYQEEASRGRIDEDQCLALQQISGEACGCQPPPTWPTDAPTAYECEVCGAGREVGSPDSQVILPNYQMMSCGTLQERAETGAIHYSQCARFVPIAQQYCDCINKPYEASPQETPSNFDCNVCGAGLKVTNPSGVIQIPNQPDRTCIELMTEAAYGNIDEANCALYQPFVQGPCGCADPYTTTPVASPVASSSSYFEAALPSPIDAPLQPAQEPTKKRGDCFQDLNEIQALERGVQDTTITRMYVLCPDTTFDLGVWTEEGEIQNGQPFLALRPNVIYQCGHDGSRTNNCILKGGDFGVASYYEVYAGIYETVSDVQIRGLTFESQNLFSVILKSAGDITFTGCAFKDNGNNVPVLMQWEGNEDILSMNRRHLEEQAEEEPLKQVVTFQDCVFRDNFLDDSTGFPGIIENTFNSELIVKNCLFQDNNYGSKNNLAGAGYAIRSFGPLTLESNCFVDNTFLNNGPVLIYGAQYSATNNYVESSQGDLTCELGALFSSQDDMAETNNIPTCISSDASVCAFTQGPTSSPTIAPTSSVLPPSFVPPIVSQETPTGTTSAATSRHVSAFGVTVLPLLLVLVLPAIGL